MDNIQIGDRFLYNGNHSFYKVVGISKEKLLDFNSKSIVSFEIIVDDFVMKGYDGHPTAGLNKNYTVVKEELCNWYPVNKDLILPKVDMYDGLVITVRRHQHYIYGINNETFWTIPIEEKDPKNYLLKHSYRTSTKISWAQRLFYTGWWEICK